MSHTRERKQPDSALKQGTEENIETYEGGRNRALEKTV
jgi:hypothetical protein